MIDSHCHLAAEQFNNDLDVVLAHAKAAAVECMVCIGDTIEESEDGLKLAEKYDHIFCTVGLHPHRAKEWEPDTADRLTALVRSSQKVKAIGEIGLDYHYPSTSSGQAPSDSAWSGHSLKDVQRDVFRMQLVLAKELSLPAVVHCRDAVEDVWSIVDEIRPENLVMHCCSEKWDDVKRFVERGYMLSFTGIITYPKSDEIRSTVKQCPLDRLMGETDAPFLAPVPHRGKRNEPAFVVEVAKCVAEIKGVSLEEIDRVTTENAVKFFGLPDS